MQVGILTVINKFIIFVHDFIFRTSKTTTKLCYSTVVAEQTDIIYYKNKKNSSFVFVNDMKLNRVFDITATERPLYYNYHTTSYYFS